MTALEPSAGQDQGALERGVLQPELVQERLEELQRRALGKINNRKKNGNHWSYAHVTLGVLAILLSSVSGIGVFAAPTDTQGKIIFAILGSLGAASGAVGTFLSAQYRSVRNKAEEADWQAIYDKVSNELLKGEIDGFARLEELQSQLTDQMRADADARLSKLGPSIRDVLKDFDILPKAPAPAKPTAAGDQVKSTGTAQ